MSKRVLLAALASALSGASARIQLLPAGSFTSNDGRPGNLEGVKAQAWLLDDAAGAALVAKVNGRATPMAIDYEHQTFNSEFNGQPAPAAGWFSKVEFVPGAGLFATDVSWTEKAKAWITEQAYKFISPVFSFDKNTGVVVDLKPVALTNNPGLDMQAVALTSRFNPEEEPLMNPILKAMLAALGLTDAATEAEALAKITDLKSAAAEVVALKAKVVDPAQYVPAAVHTELTTRLTAATTELATLKAKDTGTEVEALLTAGIADAKLLGDASVAWAREQFKGDPAGLKKYLDAMPAIAALKATQTSGKTPPGAGNTGVVALSAEQKGIAKRMGLTEAAYLKTLQDEAAAIAAA